MRFKNVKNQITYLLSFLIPKNKNLWVFGAWMGRRFSDNPKAFLDYMVSVHPEYEYVWITENPEMIINSEYPQVKVLRKDTKEARRFVAKSKYVVMSHGSSDLNSYNILGGKVCIQCWHGVAWKKIGIDSLSPAHSIFDRIKRINRIWSYLLEQGADIYISPSEEFKKVLETAFWVNKKKILDIGYPRNECLLDSEKCKRARLTFDRKNGTDNKRIIAYLPTFRDKNQERFSFFDIDEPFLDKLNNIVVIEKSHFVDNEIGSQRSSQLLLNGADIPTEELLQVADILITDYSSCFYDFLLTDRPIIQFLYDYEYYRDVDRGLYYPVDVVDCGYVVYKQADLISLIEKANDSQLPETKQQMIVKHRFMTYETPDNCERLYHEIETRFMK